jgi:sugar lactone lactonase YvrE
LGYSADLGADSDFASLRGTPGYTEVAGRLARNAEPLVRSRAAFTLPETDLLAEGIAYDPVDGSFYVAAVHQRKILRVAPGGVVGVFADAGDGRWAPMGMGVDPARRLLWVAASAVPQMRGYAPADSGRGALLAFDLRSGAAAGRYQVEPDGAGHVVGDLIVARDGRVYASDSRAPVIYRVPLAGDTLERFAQSGLLLSAQGLALSPDERSLYVADYARGILRVDLRTHGVTLLEAADSALVLGIDGLYRHGAELIGVQNGVTPHRVVRLTLDASGQRVVRTRVLERAHPAHQEPTLGVVVGDDLYYIANSQWERYGENGQPRDPAALDPTVVLRLRL